MKNCKCQHDVPISLLFKIADVTFSKRLNSANEEYGLTGNQAQLLGTIRKCRKEMDEVFPSTLEERMHVSRPTMSGLLKRLEAKGFIIFAPSSKDKRYKQVLLTEKAEAVNQRIGEKIFETERKMLEGISEEDVEIARTIVKKMIDNISD